MLTTVRLLTLSLAAFCFTPHPALAQSADTIDLQGAEQSPLEMRAEQVVALVNGELEPEEIFTDGFLSAIPPAQFKTIAGQLTAQFGKALTVESLDPKTGSRASLEVRMEGAIASGGIAIAPGEDNKVSELLFQSFEPINDSLDKIEADLQALPGNVTWRFGNIADAPSTIASSGADIQMPVGSAFKLYVLAALAREVADGKRSWSDQITLGGKRSFPSGMLHDWPEGSPVTLHTLASLMISISDNTATDALIDELGREAVFQTLVDSGHSSPVLNDPFLKTRELFLLKGGPEGRLRTFRNAEADLRQQILDGIEDNPLSSTKIQEAFSGPPLALDVEWFASADDIASLFAFMRKTADPQAFEIMAINPSVSSEIGQKWAYTGYKGGSEPGVLNLSWLLQDSEGQDHALILNWRDDDKRFDPSTLELIAQRMLSLER